MTSGKSGGPPDRLELVAGVECAGLELAEVERAGLELAEVAGVELAEVAGVERAGLELAEVAGVERAGLELAEVAGVERAGLELAEVAEVERARLELAEVAEVERAGLGLAEVAGWRPIPGLYCVGGPVAGCIFALSGGVFGAPGLVLVGFGDSARCVALVNSAGYVSLNVSMGPANSRPPGSSWPPRPGGDHVR